MKEKIKLSYVHIAIIVLGIIFIAIPNFHTNLWFDEAYSVSMADRDFGEIWSIGSTDVHPILYYYVLKVISFIFGNAIIAYRFFSTLVIAILGILGYTHIRKDFGDKVRHIIFVFSIFYAYKCGVFW